MSLLPEPEERRDFAAASYRVVWGLGRHEDFATAAEADARADEIHKEMVEEWPLLAGTGDGSLPRVLYRPGLHDLCEDDTDDETDGIKVNDGFGI
jgi:hypothetical protein